MATVTLYGHSDDLVEVDANPKISGADEYNTEDTHFVLLGDDGRRVRIRVWYTRRGVWAIACAPVEEDAPMLDVALSGPGVEEASGYTAVARVKGVTTIVREADFNG